MDWGSSPYPFVLILPAGWPSHLCTLRLGSFGWRDGLSVFIVTPSGEVMASHAIAWPLHFR